MTNYKFGLKHRVILPTITKLSFSFMKLSSRYKAKIKHLARASPNVTELQVWKTIHFGYLETMLNAKGENLFSIFSHQ